MYKSTSLRKPYANTYITFFNTNNTELPIQIISFNGKVEDEKNTDALGIELRWQDTKPFLETFGEIG